MKSNVFICLEHTIRLQNIVMMCVQRDFIDYNTMSAVVDDVHIYYYYNAI